jgi:dTDP-4-amino-4,6-dideoxygalactose transaminase
MNERSVMPSGMTGANNVVVSGVELSAVWPQHGDGEREGLLRVLDSKVWCRLKDDHWQQGECGQFEREFGAYLGAKHVIAVSNGTVAIELALAALGLGPGDEVLVQAGTFFGTVTPILKRGGVPVFADFAANTCTVDPASLEALIGKNTRGVIVVPLCGLPPHMDQVAAFCRKHGLWLVEDCAQAVGSTWKGKPLGTFGDIGTFSFQQDKPLQCGEGGAVVCRDATLLGQVFAYHQGFRVNGAPDFDRHRPGTNSRLSPWQAAVLRAQLRRLDTLIDTRRANFDHLMSMLSSDDPIRPVEHFQEMDRWSICSAPFFYDAGRNGGMPRNTFLERLQQAGVPATPGHVEPLYQRPLFVENALPHRNAHCPTAEQITRDSYLSIMHWFFLGPESWMERLVRWMRQTQEYARKDRRSQ